MMMSPILSDLQYVISDLLFANQMAEPHFVVGSLLRLISRAIAVPHRSWATNTTPPRRYQSRTCKSNHRPVCAVLSLASMRRVGPRFRLGRHRELRQEASAELPQT